MSGFLWKYYLEDDVDSFRRVLETAGYTTRTTAAQKGHGGGKEIGLGIGTSAAFAASQSPTIAAKSRRTEDFAVPGLTLTRADLNHRDPAGRTLLHLAASSSAESAYDFATALLDHPLTDIYIQDSENEWTALHRAFYAGNVAIAHSIILRDVQDASGHGQGTLHHMAGGLIKIKDREGNGPFDLFEMTLEGEMTDAADLQHRPGDASDSEDEMPDNNENKMRRGSLIAYLDLQGDEMFSFGSNQNVTLGFGDEDDRHHPERITLRRPDHLYFKAYDELIEKLTSPSFGAPVELSKSGVLRPVFVSELPSVIRSKPIRIQDVQMAKLHSAILTDDAESNLHVCGHGKGGRLGLGDEQTRFQFTCVDSGAMAGKKVAAVALGLNHTVALSDQGEVFTWGSDDCGQLGYDLPKPAGREETAIQMTPRRIFGSLKRETVVGVAASRVHSVAYTDVALYTWGKNEGQLGIVHSESRSTKIQSTPRNVAASRFAAPIASVSAMDRATAVLLENHEVVVFAHYVYIRVDFPLHGFENYFLKSSFMTTKYDATPNRIAKIVSGGDTICAMSSSGQVYTITVGEPPALQDNDASTTNPKLGSRNALSSPVRAWSNKKTHLAARDVAVDQNGNIILVTESGSVWKRVKRAKIKDATASGVGEYKAKDYKYSRIPGLTRVTAVRASGSGAYAAIREDHSAMRQDIAVSESTFLADLWPLVPFQTLYPADEDEPAFPKRDLVDVMMKSEDPDEECKSILRPRDALALPYDLLLCSTTSDIEIPVHQFIVSARSKIIRTALEELALFEHFTVPDLALIKKGDDGRIRITFQGADVLTLFNLALYFYTDSLAPVWNVKSKHQQMAFRYRQTRTELQKIAGKLELNYLESVLRRVTLPASTLHQDFERAYADPSFFENADVVISLAEGEEVWVHGALMCQRCKFFDGLFRGRTGGQWLAERRQKLQGPEDAIRVDLSNIQPDVFQRVLRHVYAGTGPELFDDVVADGLDEFLDIVLDVMSAANELMVDRLSEVCQQVVGRYVTTRNVVQLLNAIAPCSVTTFKDRALEYICYNFEAVLQHGHLEELDEDLFLELDEKASRLQVDCSIMSRTGRQEARILHKYPDLQKRIDAERQAKVDSIVLLNKYGDLDAKVSTSFRAGSFHEIDESVLRALQSRRRSSVTGPASPSPSNTPVLRGKGSVAELMFEMDDDEDAESASASKGKPTSPYASPDLSGRNSFASSWTMGGSREMASKSPVSNSENSRPSKPPGQPWAAATLPSIRLGMREIMEQANSSRTSTLSMSLASSQGSAQKSNSGPPGSGKMSQKERKKLQQQGLLGTKSEPVMSLSPAPTPASPWQMSGSRPKAPAKPPPDNTTTQVTSTPQPKPHLTMRQTVANTRPPSKNTPSRPDYPLNSPPPNPATPATPSSRASSRIVSARQSSTATTAAPADSPGFAISDGPVPIHSVRHVPQRVSTGPTDQRPMLDILAEQASQKMELSDFAAKRSLTDIQQEQEFQVWWERESRRVREEEEAAARRVARSAKAGGGRGGRARAKASAKVEEDGPQQRRGKMGRRRGRGKTGEDVAMRTTQVETPAD